MKLCMNFIDKSLIEIIANDLALLDDHAALLCRTRSIFAANQLRKRSHCMIHLGPWESVNTAWRSAYSLSSLTLCQLELEKHSSTQKLVARKCIRRLDMALLLGGPLFHAMIHEFIHYLESDILKGDPLSTSPDTDTEASESSDEYENSLKDEDDEGDDECDEEEKASDSSGSVTSTNFVDSNENINENYRIPLEQSEHLDIFEFKRKYFEKAVPVRVSKALLAWPAANPSSSRSWQETDRLLQVLGRRTVPVEVGEHYLSDTWRQSLMSFRRFYYRHWRHSAPAQIGYVAQTRLFEQVPALMSDIAVPDFCALRGLPGLTEKSDGEAETGPPKINIWIGPGSTRSPLHQDPENNLLCQVVGRKYIRLYHHNQSQFLYQFPASDRARFNSSQVIDPTLSDAEHRFPLLKHAQYTECILEPGQMLYIPPKTWHYVQSLSTSVSVSFWFK